MARRNLRLIIFAVYIAIFITLDFLIPYFLPRYAGDTDFIPFFFFIPFFWIGGRRSRSSGNGNYGNPQPDTDTSGNKPDYQNYASGYEYDEFGIPKRRNNTRLYYIIGAIVIVVAIAISFLVFL
jgi:hypothetical protein